MRSFVLRYGKATFSILFFVALFLFWWQKVPYLLSYHEQYQLFLWTSGYLLEAMCIPGGLAAWIGEFVVQFFYVEWLGALLLALLLVLLQRLVAIDFHNQKWYVLSVIPPIMVGWLMADESVLISYLVALMIAIGCHLLTRKLHYLFDFLIIPVLYWIIGPMVWLCVILNVVTGGLKRIWAVLPAAAIHLVAYHFLLPEWQLYSVLTGRVYYRIPLHVPTLMWIIPFVVVALVLISRLSHKKWIWVCKGGLIMALICLAWSAFYSEKMQLIEQDWLVRNEQWDKLIERASHEQVHTSFSSVCVNLALAKKHQLADRMFDFFQSGPDALIMPRIRDLTSMLPSAEAFWHLGMINSAQRYMFDTQESILNGKKSGRCTKRIAECMIVNGHYKNAAKQIRLLSKTLFYRSWAKEAKACLYDENKVKANPLWAKQRQLRYKSNFLFDYEHLDRMFASLFTDNTANTMALDYLLAQMLLEGNINDFVRNLNLAQRYGGYSGMPLVYQDVMTCIQTQGRTDNSPYIKYLSRMRQRR